MGMPSFADFSLLGAMKSEPTLTQWFMTQFGGSIIAGLVALTALYFTLRFNRQKQREDRAVALKKDVFLKWIFEMDSATEFFHILTPEDLSDETRKALMATAALRLVAENKTNEAVTIAMKKLLSVSTSIRLNRTKFAVLERELDDLRTAALGGDDAAFTAVAMTEKKVLDKHLELLNESEIGIKDLIDAKYDVISAFREELHLEPRAP